MAGPNSKKAVYYTEGEEYLKNWAESRPEGYSVYIKRLIREDLDEDRKKAEIRNILQELIRSVEFKNVLLGILENCNGIEVKSREDDVNITATEADDILGLITGI